MEKIQISVMPAWKEQAEVKVEVKCPELSLNLNLSLFGASGDIHVNLDSSAPCWNDTIEAFCLD